MAADTNAAKTLPHRNKTTWICFCLSLNSLREVFDENSALTPIFRPVGVYEHFTTERTRKRS